MKEQIEKIKKEALETLKNCDSEASLEAFRVRYFGRREGLITNLLKALAGLGSDERRAMGKFANEMKSQIETEFKKCLETIEKREGERSEWIDVTQPGAKKTRGHLHITTRAIEEIVRIFTPLGFVLRRYPEAEWDYYAFESLNMPSDHPARDEWETFFIDEPRGEKGEMVLTPHTSNGQVREMERAAQEWGMPIRMMNISKCYRRQSDISHVPMFYQFEGLAIDAGINLTHLKGTLQYFAERFFGSERKIRLRPFHFRFTEPSFEVDVTCDLCEGSGFLDSSQSEHCRMCKSGWLELGGAGMVHPNVLKAGGIDPKEYSGFAFGFGVERTYMMKAGLKVDDIRVLYKNDLKFLEQF